jgi:hypothetical protein
MNDLYDALRQRAESAPLQSADLGIIRARARSIRRRRAAIAVVGSAAAVAVIAGLGFALAPNGANHAVPPVSSTSAVPTPTATASETPNDLLPEKPVVGPLFTVSTQVTGVGQTDAGAERVPYWRDGQLVAPDGTPTPLKDRPDAVALAQDGSWWVTTTTDNTQLTHLSAAGHPIGTSARSVAKGIAAAPGRLATISMSSGGWVLTTNNRTFDLQNLTPYAQVDGFAANGDVYFNPGDGIERLAHVADGTIEKLPHVALVDTSPTGLTALAMDDGNWLVQDSDGADRWSMDFASIDGFSPDGRYVSLLGDQHDLVKGSQYWDEEGITGTLWIRGASDDSPVAVFNAPRGGFFGPRAWEGGDILALVFERDSAAGQTGTWTLVRLSADGYKMVRSASWSGDIHTPPYVFGTAVTPAP